MRYLLPLSLGPEGGVGVVASPQSQTPLPRFGNPKFTHPVCSEERSLKKDCEPKAGKDKCSLGAMNSKDFCFSYDANSLSPVGNNPCIFSGHVAAAVETIFPSLPCVWCGHVTKFGLIHLKAWERKWYVQVLAVPIERKHLLFLPSSP